MLLALGLNPQCYQEKNKNGCIFVFQNVTLTGLLDLGVLKRSFHAGEELCVNKMDT